MPSEVPNGWMELKVLLDRSFVPIVKHPETDIELGLLDDEVWMVRNGDRAARLFHSAGVVAGWRLLELDFQVFTDQLRAARLANSKNEFPIERYLFDVILRSGREFWIEKALDWLKQLPPEQLVSHLEQLKAFEKDKSHTQSNRHRVKHIVAAVKRTTGLQNHN